MLSLDPLIKLSAKRSEFPPILGEEETINTDALLDGWHQAIVQVTPISYFSYASNTEMSQYCSSPSLVGYLTRLNFVRVIEEFYDLSPE